MAFTPHSGASGSLDLVAANAALKELYNDQRMLNLAYPDKPFLAMLEKRQITKAEGKYIPQPVIAAPPMGRSTTFAAALNNQSALNAQSFFLQRFQNHQVVSIDDEAYAATADDIGSFLNAAKLAIDPGIEYLARNINSALFRDGTGTLSQIGTISTGVITLVNSDDVVQFEPNMILVASATAGGATYGTVVETGVAPISGGFIGTVQAVDRTLGTVTVYTTTSGTAASPTNWVAGSYLRVFGDTSGTTSPGLAAWLPSVAPGSTDNFYQVNRSVDATRLAGVRFNGSNQGIEEALIQSAALVNREGGNPETCIINFTSWQALQKSLGSKVRYMDHKVGEISFRGIEVATGSGTMTVFADRDCQAKTAYLLQMKHWNLWSLGNVPKINDTDGMTLLRSPTTNSLQVRLNAYYVLGCNAPGRNAVVQLSE